ncbi:hypothetical protein YC2023_108186 [Brassica napus]
MRMHGLVSYRRFARARSLRSNRAGWTLGRYARPILGCRGKSQASMSRRAQRSLQNLGHKPGWSGRRLPTLETAQPEHVAWCPVHSRRPLKIRRTECRSRPVVLITASGLQGEQPLVDGTM